MDYFKQCKLVIYTPQKVKEITADCISFSLDMHMRDMGLGVSYGHRSVQLDKKSDLGLVLGDEGVRRLREPVHLIVIAE